MIRGEHATVRGAEQDDAAALKELYDPEWPRAALLDRRRELVTPSVDEVRELFAQKQQRQGAFLTIEDPTGRIVGFSVLRGLNPEVGYGEAAVLLADPAAYAAPLADEVLEFMLCRAFVRFRLHKVIAQCLEGEESYEALLARRGFVREGVHREVMYTQGRYFDLATLALFKADWAPPAPAPV